MKKKKIFVIRKKASKTVVPRNNASKPHVPKNDKEFVAKEKAFDVIAKMRRDDKLSLANVSKELGTTPSTVRKYLPATLRKSKAGKWVATKSDRYIRHLSLPGQYGPVTVKARGSKEAQLASAYLASVRRWRVTQKARELAPFRGKKIDGHKLITNPQMLFAFDEAGLLQLDSLYAALKESM